MEYIKEKHQILTRENVNTDTQEAVVKKGYCLYYNLKLTENNGIYTVELREPTIEGTEWQGELIRENITVTVLADNQETGQVDLEEQTNLSDGVGEFELDLPTGTHIVEVTAPQTESDSIEVTI